MFTNYKFIGTVLFITIFLGSIVGTVWYAYNYAYQQGFSAGVDKATSKCESEKATFQQKIANYETERSALLNKILEKIGELHTLSKDLADEHARRQQEIKDDIDRIRRLANSKQLVVIKDGKCVLSKDFVDTYNSMISKGNTR